MKKHFVEFWDKITSMEKAIQRAEIVLEKIKKYEKI